MIFHAVADNAFTTLASACAIDAVSIVVVASDLDDIAVPFYADMGKEIVEVTEVTEDTPTAGQSTWTITRAVQGDAAAYGSGAPVVQRVYARQTNELQTALYRL